MFKVVLNKLTFERSTLAVGDAVAVFAMLLECAAADTNCLVDVSDASVVVAVIASISVVDAVVSNVAVAAADSDDVDDDNITLVGVVAAAFVIAVTVFETPFVVAGFSNIVVVADVVDSVVAGAGATVVVVEVLGNVVVVGVGAGVGDRVVVVVVVGFSVVVIVVVVVVAEVVVVGITFGHDEESAELHKHDNGQKVMFCTSSVIIVTYCNHTHTEKQLALK
jgi:hypothetical protein